MWPILRRVKTLCSAVDSRSFPFIVVGLIRLSCDSDSSNHARSHATRICVLIQSVVSCAGTLIVSILNSPALPASWSAFSLPGIQEWPGIQHKLMLPLFIPISMSCTHGCGDLPDSTAVRTLAESENIPILCCSFTLASRAFRMAKASAEKTEQCGGRRNV